MTVRDIALILLRDFGVRSLDPASNLNNRNARGISTGDLEAVCQYINGALQELFNDGPAAISERPLGEVLRPETAVTLTATQYSKTISAVTTFASWMVGCTIRIAGDSYDNELLSSTELARPYMGTTGSSKTASVWGDAVQVASNVSHLITPINLVGSTRLEVVTTRQQFQYVANDANIRGLRDIGVQESLTYNKVIGTPAWAFVDTRYDTAATYLPKILRVAPMPGQAFTVVGKLKVTPPVITPANIDNGDHTTDPNVTLAADWLESVVLPIARQRASSDALFCNKDGLGEIARQFVIARAIMKGETPLRAPMEGIYH